MKRSLKTISLLLLGFAFFFSFTRIASGVPQSGKSKVETKQASSRSAKNNKVDLNTADEKELDQLPGIGPAYAKKIIENRPYSSVSGLSKAGLPQSAIEKIRPLVTAKNPRTAENSTKSRKSAPPQDQTQPNSPQSPEQTPPSERQKASAAQAPSPAGSGMVWVNLDSRVYHHEGSRWYGKTKNGKYMSEADAIKAGYRAAKNNE